MRLSPRQGVVRSGLGMLYACALLLPGLLNAQADADRQENSSRPGRAASVVQADRLVDRMQDGEPVTDLLGNVYIDRDTVTARSDTARYWRLSEIYELWGNVKLRQLQTVLNCDRAVYYRDRGAADFFGSVRIEDAEIIGTSERGESRNQGHLLRLFDSARLVSPDYTVWADTIVRDRATEVSEASGRVKIVDSQANTLVTGDHAVFAADGSSARVDRNPSLTTREQQGVPLESTAGVMYFYQDDQRIVMVDSVKIWQGVTEAEADTAVFLGRETMILRGNPRVWIGDQSTMVGDEIEFRYRNQQLDSILLQGQARMEDSSPDSLAQIYKGLPALDVLEGDTITVSISAGKVQRSVTIGHAHSVYVPTDLDDEVAYNDVYGDTIVIFFKEDQVDRVDVAGNMKGTYTFGRLANLARQSEPFVPGIPVFSDPDSTGSVGADSLGGASLDSLTSARSDSLGPARGDSLFVISSPDSTVAHSPQMADLDSSGTVLSGAADSTTTGVPGKYDFVGGAEKVTYSGHAVEFQMAERTIDIQQEAELTYGTMTLTADQVRLDTVERELYADGNPLLIDSDQRLVGDRMGYNFDYKSGAVKDGTTSFEQRYYDGKEIKRFDDGSLKIKSGNMTSCDLEDPHYRFWSHKMKLKLEDKVVAKPVVVYIGEVPTFALPFYFKSLKSGRRSGILFPNFNFGWSGRDGRYIRDLGYYWATNDYMDFSLQADYNERQNWNFRIINRYVKRYAFTGGVQYTWRQSVGDQPDEREWQFRWNHNQDKLFDVYSLRGNVNLSSRTLSSNDLSREIGREIVSGQMRSDLTLSRSWSLVNGNATISRDQRVNAEDDDPSTDNALYSQVIPQVSLGFRRLPLLGQAPSGQTGSFGGNLLRATYFTQSYTFQLNQEQREVSRQDAYRASGNWRLNTVAPRIGIFNITVGVSASQNWTNTVLSGQSFAGYDTSYAEPDSTLVLTPIYVPIEGGLEETRPTLSVNSGVSTTLFGVLPLKLGALQALRHTFRFSAGHTWRPTLGSKQIESQSVSFNMNNRFDVKYLSGSASDTLPEYKKLDGILDWGLNTSYNPDDRNGRFWSNVGSNINIKPGQSRNLNFRVSNTIDPYLWKVIDTRLTYGLNFNGRITTGGKVAEEEPPVNKALERLGVNDSTTTAVEGSVTPEQEYEMLLREESDPYAGFERPVGPLGGERDPTNGGQFIPWNVSASLSYNNRTGGTSSARTNMTFAANLSRKWEFRYRLSYDIILGRAIRQEYSLYRDLHCWRLEFSRIISDVDSQYGFRIYLVDIPSLKLSQGNDQLLGSLGSGSLY